MSSLPTSNKGHVVFAAPSENKPGKRSGAPKGKGAPKENKAQPKAAAAQTRIKKEYELPGQTRDIPPENDGLRRFYTTLLEQKPRSEMARKYCVMYGLLSRAEAEAWVEEQARRKGRSPTKMVPKKKRLSNVEKGAGRTKEKLKRKKPDANSVEEGPVNGGKISSIQSIQPRKAKTNRDVAFVDGGLGDSSDSDSDIPLIMFKNKQKAT